MKIKLLILSLICTSIISIKASAASAEEKGEKIKQQARVRVGSSQSIGSTGSSSRDMGLRIRTPKSEGSRGITYGFLP